MERGASVWTAYQSRARGARQIRAGSEGTRASWYWRSAITVRGITAATRTSAGATMDRMRRGGARHIHMPAAAATIGSTAQTDLARRAATKSNNATAQGRAAP